MSLGVVQYELKKMAVELRDVPGRGIRLDADQAAEGALGIGIEEELRVRAVHEVTGGRTVELPVEGVHRLGERSPVEHLAIRTGAEAHQVGFAGGRQGARDSKGFAGARQRLGQQEIGGGGSERLDLQ